MSVSEFRWMLLFFGLLVLLGIYLHGRWQIKQRNSHGNRRDPLFDRDQQEPAQRGEPSLGEPDFVPPPDSQEQAAEADSPTDVQADSAPGEPARIEQPSLVFPDEASTDQSGVTPPPAGSENGSVPPPQQRPQYRPPEDVEKVVLLHVRGRGEARFRGKAVIDAATRAGLTLGREGMFHRVLDSEPGKPVLFSMANMLNPGVFEVDKPEAIDTVGVSLFMSLPGAREALEGFDAMHATAKHIGEVLDGEVLDENLSTLSRQRLLHLRDEMRAFDRSRHLS